MSAGEYISNIKQERHTWEQNSNNNSNNNDNNNSNNNNNNDDDDNNTNTNVLLGKISKFKTDFLQSTCEQMFIFKEATKLYFRHYSCVVIILVNTS